MGEEKELYCIGQVGEICNLSKKAIRYYDKMGILSPDKVSDGSGYRYYTKRTLLSVPMIKYYKQSGFKLEEMKELLDVRDHILCEKCFRKKINELKELENDINLKLKSVNDWYELIIEAEMVLENDVKDISIKYIEPKKMIFLEQGFNYDYMESIINIEFTNYIEEKKNAITGPVIIQFPSFEEKMNGNCKKIKIMQETLFKCKEEDSINFGGFMIASCYHIGNHETINETYEKIRVWANKNGYKCSEESYERYVTDYWTTKNSQNFVTEVMLRISRGNR